MLLSDDIKVDSQEQCLLFARFPPEVRKQIWTYTVLAHNDLEHPYPENSHWYRPPDHTHYQIIDTTILSTCRAIYIEAKDLPALVNTFVVWQDLNRAPPTLNSAASLTPNVRGGWHRHLPHRRELPALPPSQNIRNVKLLAQQYCQSDNFREV